MPLRRHIVARDSFQLRRAQPHDSSLATTNVTDLGKVRNKVCKFVELEQV